MPNLEIFMASFGLGFMYAALDLDYFSRRQGHGHEIFSRRVTNPRSTRDNLGVATCNIYNESPPKPTKNFIKWNHTLGIIVHIPSQDCVFGVACPPIVAPPRQPLPSNEGLVLAIRAGPSYVILPLILGSILLEGVGFGMGNA